MKTLIVAAIISVATADITTTTTSTINNGNNSESTYLKNFTGSTIKVSILTSENPELVNTTESTNVLVSRRNGTKTRQGKITEVNNNTSHIQYLNQDSNENKNIDKDEHQLEIEFVTKPPKTHKDTLKNIFETILSYKQIHVEKPPQNEKEKIIKAYLLLVSQKYKRKWVPKKLGVKVLPVKNVTSKVRTSNKRPKRSIKEEAGFTHDAETCKQYNNNLLLLWSNLSKYIGTSEKSPPNKSVLHNIGIMIKAYLDHVYPIEMITESTTEKIVRKERNISSILSPIVKEIKIKMDRKEVNEVNTLTAFILEQVKRFRIDNVNQECNKIIQNQIATLTNIAFKKYLLYANCNNFYNTGHSNGNVDLNNMPPNNNELYGKLQSSNVPKIDEPRLDNLLKLVKRSTIDTTNATDTSTHNTDLSPEISLNNPNNVTTNETSSTNENQQNSSQDTLAQGRRAFQLNGKYCANLALDQFILTVKLILRLYLLNDDCTQRANKFMIISKLIEATPILEPFNANNLDYLSQYHVLLQLLDNMETADMSNLFSTSKSEVLQNKNTLEDFLHDINNLAISLNNKQAENNNIPDNSNDIKHQNLINSLYNYQHLSYNNDEVLNPKKSEPISVNTGNQAISQSNVNNEVNQNFKDLQGMYTGIPINQHFESNRSVVYNLTNSKTYDKPIKIGASINSGSINYSNNIVSSSKSQTAPNLFSSTAKEYSAINPMQYNLIMNYSESFPTNVKGNLDSSRFVLPYLNVFNGTYHNVNPFINTMIDQNSASNSGTLSNYFSKFAKINNNQGYQLHNSPSVPNNNVLFNILTKNNKDMLNNNFNTNSQLTINEASVKKYVRKPALEQQNLNVPSNFGVNSGVNYYNQNNIPLTNNINSYPQINNNFNSLRDDNLVRDTNAFNPFNFNNFNALHFMKPNVLRSNLNDIKNSVQPNIFNANLGLKDSNVLRTLNVPQIQKTPIIYRTDITPNSTIVPVYTNTSLQESKSSYIRTHPIRASKISGVPIIKPKHLFKSLFINPFSYSKAQMLNKEDEFEKYFNSANAPFLRSNFQRTNDPKLETKKIPIISVDNLPTISSDPDANGDVELTYVFHHPQIVVYRPQVLVKRRISYIDYINNFNKIFNNQNKNQQQLHLYKIIRYLPHNNLQVLYQSDSLFPILKVENSTSTN